MLFSYNLPSLVHGVVTVCVSCLDTSSILLGKEAKEEKKNKVVLQDNFPVSKHKVFDFS